MKMRLRVTIRLHSARRCPMCTGTDSTDWKDNYIVDKILRYLTILLRVSIWDGMISFEIGWRELAKYRGTSIINGFIRLIYHILHGRFSVEVMYKCNITVTSQWARWRLKSPASLLFTQLFVQAQIKENIKAPRHWLLCGEFVGVRWIPPTKGQWHGKCFRLMTSSRIGLPRAVPVK